MVLLQYWHFFQVAILENIGHENVFSCVLEQKQQKKKKKKNIHGYKKKKVKNFKN